METEIKAIMFDYGGVIALGSGPKDISRDLEKKYSLAKGTIFPAFRKFYNEAKVGNMSDKDFWLNFLNQAGIPFKEKENVKKTFLNSQMAKVDKKLLDYIGRLKKDYFTIMLTNNIEFWFEHDREKLKLDDYFDSIFTSYGMKKKKPDLDIYGAVVKDFCFEPKEYGFTDDQLPNIIGARKAGMNAFQYKNLAQLKSDFRTLGVKTE